MTKLQEMNIPFQTSKVIVPEVDHDDGIVTQFFFRDPDGYYIEFCNCEILTDYCLGREQQSSKSK